ncbi:hypothetical protein FEM48_Zijuj07G0045000 [Ziziphus jujuba var. spinosa]|uniref:Uncharacterized protein n=1 Tax=Ziziphus jujuba var. spinosa TaxID=714518 RepID=A0A978V2G3_ZIZJJ|nr:hypothetical protein FEM48_Zijuj07G0045000 [Ziziphus jujuba var. spinosa]
MASDIIFLKDEKLRILAASIHGIERKNLGDLQFRSTTEQVVPQNLQLQSSIRGEPSRLEWWNTQQIFNNYTLRRDYLHKPTSHLQNLIQELDDLDTSNSADVVALTDQIVHYNEAVINYTKMTQNNRASQEFSRRLRNSGIDFQPSSKEASGRGKVVHDKVVKGIAFLASYRSDAVKDITNKDVTGKAMLLKNAATITWDVYTSDHPIRTATRNAIVEIAKKGGALLEDIATAAMVTLEVAEATSLFVGFVAGFIGGYIVGEIAGTVFDAIFGSAGNDPLPNKDFLFYVATMPDGKELARIIA